MGALQIYIDDDVDDDDYLFNAVIIVEIVRATRIPAVHRSLYPTTWQR